MDKLKIIRENAAQFKKHIQELENLESKKRDQNDNNIMPKQNQENKKQNDAENYLKELAQKASSENKYIKFLQIYGKKN